MFAGPMFVLDIMVKLSSVVLEEDYISIDLFVEKCHLSMEYSEHHMLLHSIHIYVQSTSQDFLLYERQLQYVYMTQ